MSKFTLIFFIVADAVAIGLSVFSAVFEYRAGKRLATAVRELHQSHVELHEFISKRLQNEDSPKLSITAEP